MRIFAAQLFTETNTFAPNPTGWGGFVEFGVRHGDASLVLPNAMGTALVEVRRLCEADGHEFIEGLCTFAQPAGKTIGHVYEALRDDILGGIQSAAPLDAVLLILHGAMVADGCDDCEGDLIARTRDIVGPAVAIGVTLDLHCHFTEQMEALADICVAYKEYPHTDLIPRLREAYRLIIETAKGSIRPVTRSFDCRMVGLWPTTREPMAGFVKRMMALEGVDGVLSVSLGHGFPWGDVPDAGAKVWVVTDDDPAKASALAEELGREFWNLRELTASEAVGIDEALDRAFAIEGGPIVLADMADNPGGGAPGDSTFLLRRMVERGVRNAAIGCFWDIGAIQMCWDVGPGATIDLRIGGKCGPSSGDPLDLRVTVRAVSESHMQSETWLSPLGRAVWVTTDGGVDIVLASIRSQVYGRSALSGLGMDLESKKIIVVKSTQHFYADFAAISKATIYVSSPGALTHDFATIPYRRRELRYWPRVSDPFVTAPQ